LEKLEKTNIEKLGKVQVPKARSCDCWKQEGPRD